VVRDSPARHQVGFGGSDVEAAVDLHGVEGDDLDVAERLRDRDCDCGFARRRGADEGQVFDRRVPLRQPAVTGMRGTGSPASQWGAASRIRTLR
jgi:hypothetical protein